MRLSRLISLSILLFFFSCHGNTQEQIRGYFHVYPNGEFRVYDNFEDQILDLLPSISVTTFFGETIYELIDHTGEIFSRIVVHSQTGKVKSYYQKDKKSGETVDYFKAEYSYADHLIRRKIQGIYQVGLATYDSTETFDIGESGISYKRIMKIDHDGEITEITTNGEFDLNWRPVFFENRDKDDNKNNRIDWNYEYNFANEIIGFSQTVGGELTHRLQISPLEDSIEITAKEFTSEYTIESEVEFLGNYVYDYFNNPTSLILLMESDGVAVFYQELGEKLSLLVHGFSNSMRLYFPNIVISMSFENGVNNISHNSPFFFPFVPNSVLK
jgi:hypothetical protein